MKWTPATKKISELKAFSKNPRIITDEGLSDLTDSMSKFGSCQAIVINQDGTIIGGHARFRVLQLTGASEAICNVPDRMLNEQEVKELNIRLNKKKCILANPIRMLRVAKHY